MIVQSKWADPIFKVPRWFGIKADAMLIHPKLLVFGTWVDLESKYGKCLLVHERTHIKQMERYGWPKQYFMYLWQYCRYGYKNMPFEVEAREAQKECMEVE